MAKHKIFLLGVLALGIAACSTPSERHIKRGHRYLTSGRLDRAEHELRQALEKNPSSPQAHFGLGYILFRQDELDKAVEAYKQGITIDPHDPNSHYYLGLIYNEKNMQKEAREEFKLYDKLKRAKRR